MGGKEGTAGGGGEGERGSVVKEPSSKRQVLVCHCERFEEPDCKAKVDKARLARSLNLQRSH